MLRAGKPVSMRPISKDIAVPADYICYNTIFNRVFDGLPADVEKPPAIQPICDKQRFALHGLHVAEGNIVMDLGTVTRIIDVYLRFIYPIITNFVAVEIKLDFSFYDGFIFEEVVCFRYGNFAEGCTQFHDVGRQQEWDKCSFELESDFSCSFCYFTVDVHPCFSAFASTDSKCFGAHRT